MVVVTSTESLAQSRPPSRVGDILSAPGLILARCRDRTCGAVTAIEIDPALYDRLRTVSLDRLEDGLRCTCGARRGALSPWGGESQIDGALGRLFLFVA